MKQRRRFKQSLTLNDRLNDEPAIDPMKALLCIRILARAAQESDDAALLRKRMEMILTIAGRTFQRGPT